MAFRSFEVGSHEKLYRLNLKTFSERKVYRLGIRLSMYEIFLGVCTMFAR